MSKCSSSCPAPGTHATLGECLRAKSIKVAYANSAGGMDYTAQKNWDRDLSYYKEARAQGVQPSGTGRKQVENALSASDKLGSAYQAG